jgi:hypothetical protein
MSVDALLPQRVVVYLNRFDADCDLHRRNLEWLTERVGYTVMADVEALARLVESVCG